VRTKVTLVLVFLNVALFFYIFKFERHWRTEATTLEARRRVLGPEAADIRHLEVTAPGVSYSLVRTREAWFLTRPLDWPANPHAVSSMVHELQLLEHETSFRVADLAQTSQSLADYGLEQPKMTVAFRSGDPTDGAGGADRPVTRLQVGDTTRDGRRVYILSPDGRRIHVVGRALIERLSLPLEQLRADTLLTIAVFEARSLTVQSTSPNPVQGTSAGVRIRLRRDGARWSFETPIVARASKTAVDLTINDLNRLQAKTFNPPPPATLPSAAPTLRLMLEGTNRYETLFLGEPLAPVGAAAAEAASAGTEYYAQLDGRSALFTVVMPKGLVATLRNAQESLREKRILEFDPQAVTAITLAAPELPGAPLTLQRLEATAGGATETPRWQIVRRGVGDQGPQTVAADGSTVQNLLEQLTLLQADLFKSDAPTGADLEAWGFNRPEREITLTLAGNATPIVLRFGTDASRSVVYARPGTPTDAGSSIYTVTMDVRRALPVAVSDWRDRSLREPLPPDTRFSTLTISEVPSGAEVFATTFDAAGEPTRPASDPAALRELLARLRALRARSFLPAGFADQVSLAGEEFPWRYRLDATLSLPGGGTEPSGTITLLFTDRLGGNRQFAGSKERDAIFELEQPFLDALWKLLYGPRDPGPPTPSAKQ